MDWPILVALITVATGLYTAYNTRQHTTSEIFTAAMEAAKAALEIRDQDIERLSREIERSVAKINLLVQYTEYISKWIRDNVAKDRPLSYDEFSKDPTLKR